LGPARRVFGNHCPDGIGKFNLSRAERNRDSAGRIPGRAGEIEYLGRDCGGNIWFMAWGIHHVLGIVMAWTDRDRKMGAFFCDQRIKVNPIFFARLLPVIRHLISIPAGIIRMNFMTFSVMTVIGSAIWCAVLAWFGQTAITPEMLHDPTGLAIALKAKSHVIAAGVLVLCVLYFVVMRLTAGPGKKTRL
jgi:SNARE associated Golgi protein